MERSLGLQEDELRVEGMHWRGWEVRKGTRKVHEDTVVRGSRGQGKFCFVFTYRAGVGVPEVKKNSFVCVGMIFFFWKVHRVYQIYRVCNL